MYRFTETNEQAIGELSPVAFNYNGETLDDVISGFRTLNVIGRESFVSGIESVASIDGTVITGRQKQVENIVVVFLLEAESEEELQNRFSLLKKKLILDHEVYFSFADEEANYIGELYSLGNIDTISYQASGEIELLRTSVYKFSDERESSGNINVAADEVMLDQIKATATESSNNLEITNGKYVIRFIEQIAKNDVILIDFRNSRVYKNGAPFDYGIALDSDFENFEVESGQTITANKANLNIKYRGRWF